VPVFHEDETVTLRLWWSVDTPLARDYSVGAYVMNGATVLHSTDSAPQVVSLSPADTPPPDATSQWQPGTFYIEERELTIPVNAQAIRLSVYQWWDGERVSAPPANDADLLLITPVSVKAW
jgi:hypothetical protein